MCVCVCVCDWGACVFCSTGIRSSERMDIIRRIFDRDASGRIDSGEFWKGLQILNQPAQVYRTVCFHIIYKPCMTDNYIKCICGHYGLYGNAPAALKTSCCIVYSCAGIMRHSLANHIPVVLTLF
eukprot:COSAG05_NODE_1448_length_4863_cov_4.217674_3_plen_125_part_00